MGGAVGKWLAHSQRAVGKLGVGRDERHVGSTGRELRERQPGLQGGNAAADDDHAQTIGVWDVGGHLECVVSVIIARQD